MRHPLLIVGFLACLLAGCGGDGPAFVNPTSVGTTTTAPATTVATTTTGAPTPAGLSWYRVPHDEAVLGGAGDQMMAAVVAWGPGLVAVGSDASGGDADAAVWTSADGLAWSRAPHDEAVLGGPDDQAMWAVVAWGPGLLAVGGDGPWYDRDAAVWTSVDGLVWSRVPHDEAVLGGPHIEAMNAVTAGGPGLVAVGIDGEDADPVVADAAVWTSPDGLVWSRVPHDEAVFGGSGVQTMSAVVVKDGLIVAVGHGRSAADDTAAVWTSPDGLVWSRVPHDEAVFGGPGDQSMLAVVPAGPGLVAVGASGAWNEAEAAVWTSPDGLVWSRVPHDEAVFGGPNTEMMQAALAVGSGVVAVGCYDAWGGTGDADGAVWTSPDGLMWSRAPHEEGVLGGSGEQYLVGVAALPGRLVAVGYDDGLGDRAAAVWVSPPPG